MKVKIKTKGFRAIFYLPTALVLSNTGLSILLHLGKNYISIPTEKRESLMKEMITYRRQWKHLTLVEVHTMDGEEVVVTL